MVRTRPSWRRVSVCSSLDRLRALTRMTRSGASITPAMTNPRTTKITMSPAKPPVLRDAPAVTLIEKVHPGFHAVAQIQSAARARVLVEPQIGAGEIERVHGGGRTEVGGAGGTKLGGWIHARVMRIAEGDALELSGQIHSLHVQVLAIARPRSRPPRGRRAGRRV